MKSIRHPNFILGLISLLIMVVGIGMRANGMQGGNYVIGTSFVLGGIHWIWSIVDVLKSYRIKSPSENSILWVILVIVTPPVGSMLFYAMNKTMRM
jgi:hypothetical protein